MRLMESDGLPRRGSTPIVRVHGESIVYFVWVSLPRAPYDGLMIRCDRDGNILVSIRTDPEECNRYRRQ